MFKILICSLAISIMASCSFDKSDQENSEITVEIKYGIHKVEKCSTIKWKPEITALEAIQYAATVETHPVGKYVFVSAIDSVRGVRGESAWYFKVNGKSSKKIAINRPISAGDTITWIYKEDVCSRTVDGCKEKK